MSNLPIDINLEITMDVAYNMFRLHPQNKDSDDQLRMRLVANNLKELANVILLADDNEEIELNLKQLALGILGTAGWLEKGLPDLETNPGI